MWELAVEMGRGPWWVDVHYLCARVDWPEASGEESRLGRR